MSRLVECIKTATFALFEPYPPRLSKWISEGIRLSCNRRSQNIMNEIKLLLRCDKAERIPFPLVLAGGPIFAKFLR